MFFFVEEKETNNTKNMFVFRNQYFFWGVGIISRAPEARGGKKCVFERGVFFFLVGGEQKKHGGKKTKLTFVEIKKTDNTKFFPQPC